eukprot:12430157-Karenia_brevis.AAC.1
MAPKTPNLEGQHSVHNEVRCQRHASQRMAIIKADARHRKRKRAKRQNTKVGHLRDIIGDKG